MSVVLLGNSAPQRAHVLNAFEWGTAAGTDYYLAPSTNGWLTAGNAHELADYGWTTTALSFTTATGADFITSADVGTPNAITFGAASDLLQSPNIFGDWAHARIAQEFLGYLPSVLHARVIQSFSVNTGNETATGFGFVEAGGSPITAASAMAMIISDGTNFTLRSGAASDVGALVDTALHVWDIIVTVGGSVEWFIDGTSQGTIAIQTDLWPVSFGAGVQAAGVNFFGLGLTHIWYE